MDSGAHFYRCDFQVQTPRDQNWKGKRCSSDAERMQYAESLIAACRSKNLDAIAITDHHDMAFVPFIRKAALEETDALGNPLPPESKIVVFPGMELTLAVPCQALLLLDADFEDNRFEAVMTALAINPAPPEDAMSAETIRLDNVQSLRGLKEKLDEQSWLRDRYIVFPNVTGEKNNSLLRKGMAANYKEMPCVGGYVDGDVSKLKPGPLSILDGQDKGWGNKRIACIQTSDNRRADHSDLGRSTSWIKWARPTAEALRQACLAQESRISHEVPQLPSTVISSIHVSNSGFLGPIDLSLNTQYNAIIGGRGTGKSTILEYLRWALCDQPPPASSDDVPDYQSRRRRLIDKTLRPYNATVEVSFFVNEVEHVVRRNSQDNTILIKVGTDEMRSCTEEEVRTLVPIQAYSQKQLSDVSVRVEELARLITAPIRTELSRLQRQIETQEEKLKQTYASRRRRQVINAELGKRDLETRSLQGQSKNIRGSLTGMSGDDSTLLDHGPLFDLAEQLVDGWKGNIRQLSTEVDRLSRIVAANIKDNDEATLPDGPHPEILRLIQVEYLAIMTEAQTALRSIGVRAEAALAESATEGEQTHWDKWRLKLSEFRKAYDEAVQRSSVHRERLDQLKRIDALVAEQKRETARLKEELRALTAEGDAYADERVIWHEVRAQRDNLIEAQCNALTKYSDGSIRAQLRPFADASQFIGQLRDAVAGSGLRRDRLDALADYITCAEAPMERWNEVINELEVLAIFDPESEGAELRPDTPRLSAIGMSGNDLNKIAHRLSSESWLRLSLTDIKSEPIFQYRSRESEYIPFVNASSGQQATALLWTLLNQVGPPLIIDQPEDDLDNLVVQEIVQQIWQAKHNRQLIFASHNANLVVNGDAELVAWCDYRKAGDQSGGKIAGEGAIDMPTVNDAIKLIMEGGKDAFNLRKEKYGF